MGTDVMAIVIWQDMRGKAHSTMFEAYMGMDEGKYKLHLM